MIFTRLNIPHTPFCTDLQLTYTFDVPQLIECDVGQVQLILQGQGFQYMKDCTLLRKLTANDYYIQARQHKYHLMADRSTLLGRIRGDAYAKYMQQALTHFMRDQHAFIRSCGLFKTMEEDICRFLEDVVYAEGETIHLGKYIYFVKQGSLTTADRRVQVGGMVGIDGAQWVAHTQTTLKRIEKRVLATIMESWDGKSNKATWSWIDVNQQIVGQNHQAHHLVEHVQRMRQQEIKSRNTKLKIYKTKPHLPLFETHAPVTPLHKQYRINQTNIVIRSKSQQALRGNKIVYKRGCSRNEEYNHGANDEEYRRGANDEEYRRGANHIEIQTWEDVKMKTRPITRTTTAYEYAMRSLQRPSRSSFENQALKYSKSTTLKYSKSPTLKQTPCAEINVVSHSLQLCREKGYSSVDLKVEKDMVSSMLDSRKQSVLAISKEGVSERHSVEKMLSMKIIKRCQKKVQHIRPGEMTLTDKVLGKMSSLAENPLLFSIERERKKMVELSNMVKNSTKLSTNHSNNHSNKHSNNHSNKHSTKQSHKEYSSSNNHILIRD